MNKLRTVLRKLQNRSKNYWGNTKEPAVWEWAALTILLLIPFISMAYADAKSIIHYEVNFMDAILHGEFFNFYNFCNDKANLYLQMGIEGVSYATYDFPMYLVLGIWGIPLYFYGQIAGVEVTETMFGLVYGKSIYIVALVLASWLIFKICQEIGIEAKEAKWASFVFLSSLLVFVEICIIGQSDILGIVIILAGIRAFMRKQRWKFVLLFMLAVTFKLYALFVFVPMLLLIEKRVWRILADCVVVMSLTAVSGLLFLGNTEAMIQKASFSRNIFTMLTGPSLPFITGNTSLVMVLLGAVCVYCYMQQPITNDKVLKQYAVFVPLLVMGAVFVSFSAYPYWLVHLSPYLAIMLVYNSRYREKFFVFETVGMTALVMGQYIAFYWCFDVENGKHMLLEKLFGDITAIENPITFHQLTEPFHLIDYLPMLNSVYLVLLVAVIWYSRPGKLEYNSGTRSLRPLAAGRLALNVLIAYIPLVFYVINFIG